MVILFLLKESEKVKNNIEFLNIIQKTKTPKFPYNGEYLINKGFKEGKELGAILKLLEEKWINDNFKINESEISAVISKFKKI